MASSATPTDALVIVAGGCPAPWALTSASLKPIVRSSDRGSLALSGCSDNVDQALIRLMGSPHPASSSLVNGIVLWRLS